MRVKAILRKGRGKIDIFCFIFEYNEKQGQDAKQENNDIQQ